MPCLQQLPRYSAMAACRVLHRVLCSKFQTARSQHSSFQLARFQSLKWFEMATFSWQAVGKPEYLKLDCITGLTPRRSTIFSFVQHSTGEAACLWLMLPHVKSVQCCIYLHDDCNRYPLPVKKQAVNMTLEGISIPECLINAASFVAQDLYIVQLI